MAHDVLAAACRRISELYALNFTETKEFLRWLANTYFSDGARYDDFSGKTKLRQYAEFSYREILDVLMKNKKLLRIDPKSRPFQADFEREFNASVAKQRPRFEAARRLEPVVEEIVYRMYGLTPEERAVVEEAAAAIQYK